MSISLRLAVAIVVIGSATLSSVPAGFAQPFQVIKQQKAKMDFCKGLEKAHASLLVNAQVASVNGKTAEASKAKNDAANVKVVASGNDCAWAA